MATNINKKHVENLSRSDRLGLYITNLVGTMWAAFLFAGLAFVALPSAIKQGNPTVLVNWVSSNFLQLVLLPLIMVGQNLQNRKDEIRAENDYETDLKNEKRLEEVVAKLADQEAALRSIQEKLNKQG